VPSKTAIPDECWIGSDPNNAIAAGGFVLFSSNSDPGAVGTHSISGMACGNPVTPTTPVATPTALPETGAETWIMVLIAGLLVMLGGGSLALTRRR
jgi:LPXTG-motif cell wall-anchored protein